MTQYAINEFTMNNASFTVHHTSSRIILDLNMLNAIYNVQDAAQTTPKY